MGFYFMEGGREFEVDLSGFVSVWSERLALHAQLHCWGSCVNGRGGLVSLSPVEVKCVLGFFLILLLVILILVLSVG